MVMRCWLPKPDFGTVHRWSAEDAAGKNRRPRMEVCLFPSPLEINSFQTFCSISAIVGGVHTHTEAKVHTCIFARTGTHICTRANTCKLTHTCMHARKHAQKHTQYFENKFWHYNIYQSNFQIQQCYILTNVFYCLFWCVCCCCCCCRAGIVSEVRRKESTSEHRLAWLS